MNIIFPKDFIITLSVSISLLHTNLHLSPTNLLHFISPLIVKHNECFYKAHVGGKPLTTIKQVEKTVIHPSLPAAPQQIILSHTHRNTSFSPAAAMSHLEQEPGLQDDDVSTSMVCE